MPENFSALHEISILKFQFLSSNFPLSASRSGFSSYKKELTKSMDIIAQLTSEFHLQSWQVENVVKLIDEGNTIPFIARYRKEAHGTLDDQVLREISERLEYLNGERRSVPPSKGRKS